MNHIKFAQPYFLREAMTSGILPGKEDDDDAQRGVWGWTSSQSATNQQSQQSQQGDFGQGDYDPVTMDPSTPEEFEIFFNWYWRVGGGAANTISGLTPSGVDIRQWWYDLLWNMFFPGGDIDPGGGGGDGFGQGGGGGDGFGQGEGHG